MVKKSDMSKAPIEEKVKTPESEKEVKVTVHPQFTLTTPAPDLTPVIEVMKEMVGKQEPMVIQLEKDRKPIALRVTITKRDYRGLLEEFECREIVDGS